MLTAIFGPSEKGNAVLAFHGGGDTVTKEFWLGAEFAQDGDIGLGGRVEKGGDRGMVGD